MIHNITLRNFIQSPLLFCNKSTNCNHADQATLKNLFAHQKREMRQPPFTFSQQIFAFHVLQLTIILLQVESRGDNVDLLDQRSWEKKLKNNKKISNPKIKYRLLLVPVIAFRKSNKHRLLARKSEVYVIHKISILLPKVIKCSKDYKWPPRK